MSTLKKLAHKAGKFIKKFLSHFKNADGSVDFDKIFSFAETAVLTVARIETMSNDEKRAAAVELVKKLLLAEGINAPDRYIDTAVQAAYALLYDAIKGVIK